MRIFFSPYTLLSKSQGPPREGALLKWHFEGGRVGYSDLHPWESLGDLPLKKQLALLKKGEFTQQAMRSQTLAKTDAEARKRGVNLFEGLAIPKSHCHLTSLDEAMPKGFAFCKIKLGKNPEDEQELLPRFLAALPKNAKARLDFNCRVEKSLFERYLKAVGCALDKIDFIEDPFPYDRKEWEMVQKKYPLSLALDRGLEEHLGDLLSYRVAVIKPALQDLSLAMMEAKRQAVFTSYLDHPLGQLGAAYEASLAKKMYPENVLACGLLTHLVYQTNPYSEELEAKGEVLVPPRQGTGFGFDAKLEMENWIEL